MTDEKPTIDEEALTAAHELRVENSLRRAQINEQLHDVREIGRELAALGLTKLDADDRTEAHDIIRRIEERVLDGAPNLGKRRQRGMN